MSDSAPLPPPDDHPSPELRDSAVGALLGGDGVSMRVPQTEVILRREGMELARATLPPGEYVIGHGAEAHVRGDTPLLSSEHARLTINYDHCLLEDLRSSNGTFVAGQKISECVRLFPNQVILLGDVQLEIRRQRMASTPGMSLAPAQAAIQQLVPEEVLAHKRYAIGQQVARGGMGAILDAQQAAMKRHVAMKVMLEGNDAGDVARFVDEAQITGQLEHPNIVPVHELGVDENEQLFYTMKFVRGVTLKKVLELLKQGVSETVKKYPLPVLLTIFQKACDAMAFAHSKRVIHRDLKPENLMLGDYGEVLVMDWGLAKVIGKDEGGRMKDEGPRRGVVSVRGSSPEFGSTMAGTILGTPAYMAPEQARGEVETMDQRADIYSLGAILFEILHLRPPLTGSDPWVIVEKVKRGEVEWKCSVGSASRKNALIERTLHIPDSLLAVCRKSLALDRAQRYARVEDLQADIAAYQNGFATSAEDAGAWKQFTLFVKRHKAASIGVAAVLLIGSTLGTRAIIEGQRAERGEALAKTEAARANQALADLKASAPALLKLAEGEAETQRFAEALRDLDAALALDPALNRARWQRAWVLLALEKWSDAAAALHDAQRHDPGEHAHDSLLPVFDALAAAPDDAARFTPGRATEIFQHLTQAGASGEVIALSNRLMLGAKEKEKLVRGRLEAWLGKMHGRLNVLPDGTLELVGLPQTVARLEPLHGLPLGSLGLEKTAVTSLEPLRGMALTKINLDGTHVSDLSPLQGMPLTWMYLIKSDVTDLSPLKGMPLKSLDLPDRVTDLSPLAGAPLEHFASGNVVDFSPLRGAPLRYVKVLTCSDLSFLAGAPVEQLICWNCKISDLSPLRDRPLKYLELHGGRVSDLRPLAGLPLLELEIDDNPIADYTPLLELRRLEKLKISELKRIKVSLEPLRHHPSLQYIAQGDAHAAYLPVAEFWQQYDAQKGAGAK